MPPYSGEFRCTDLEIWKVKKASVRVSLQGTEDTGPEYLTLGFLEGFLPRDTITAIISSSGALAFPNGKPAHITHMSVPGNTQAHTLPLSASAEKRLRFFFCPQKLRAAPLLESGGTYGLRR